MNENNQAISSYDYDAWGNPMNSTVSEESAYRYTGREYDDETGLHNFRARLYDSALIRFYQVDPAEQFASPYVYCGNNPIGLVDPDGRRIRDKNFSQEESTSLIQAFDIPFLYENRTYKPDTNIDLSTLNPMQRFIVNIANSDTEDIILESTKGFIYTNNTIVLNDKEVPYPTTVVVGDRFESSRVKRGVNNIQGKIHFESLILLSQFSGTSLQDLFGHAIGEFYYIGTKQPGIDNQDGQLYIVTQSWAHNEVMKNQSSTTAHRMTPIFGRVMPKGNKWHMQFQYHDPTVNRNSRIIDYYINMMGID